MNTLLHMKVQVPDDRAPDLFKALAETVRRYGGTPLEQWCHPAPSLTLIEGGGEKDGGSAA